MKHHESDQASRRSLLLNVVTYAASVAVVLTAKIGPAMAGKMGQKSVSYQATPKGDLKCSSCSLFERPAACKSVEGVISPNGWCAIYKKV
jgi:hypothetical protein